MKILRISSFVLWMMGVTNVVAGDIMQELMTDRCSDMVAIVPSYDAKPDAPGTVFLVRGPDGNTPWTEPFTVKLGPDGHIRWWCHSTKGNFLDPGTWRIKVEEVGVAVNFDQDFKNPQARPTTKIKFTDSSFKGWTPERARCDSRSSKIRARLGPDRLLQVECLDEFHNGLFARSSELADKPIERIGHAVNVVAVAYLGDKLYAATKDNKLWSRSTETGEQIQWTPISHAYDIVAMAGANGKLFAVDKKNILWARDPANEWQPIGHAIDVISMASLGNKIFVNDKRNRLWVRDAVAGPSEWQVFGHAINVVGMAGVNDRLYCITNDNKLHVRDNIRGDQIQWRPFGSIPNSAFSVSMSATKDKLLFVTQQRRH